MMDIIACQVAHHRLIAKIEEVERQHLLTMTPEARDFELKLRQTRALEEIARKEVKIDIKNSIL